MSALPAFRINVSFTLIPVFLAVAIQSHFVNAAFPYDYEIELFEKIKDELNEIELEVLEDYLTARNFERNGQISSAMEMYEQVLQNDPTARIPERHLNGDLVVDSLLNHYLEVGDLQKGLELSESAMVLNPTNWKPAFGNYQIAEQLYSIEELISYCESKVSNGFPQFRQYLVASLLLPFQNPSTDGNVNYISHATFLRIWALVVEDVEDNPGNSAHYTGDGRSNLQFGLKGHLTERDLEILVVELQADTFPVSIVAAEVLQVYPRHHEIAENYLLSSQR